MLTLLRAVKPEVRKWTHLTEQCQFFFFFFKENFIVKFKLHERNSFVSSFQFKFIIRLSQDKNIALHFTL